MGWILGGVIGPEFSCTHVLVVLGVEVEYCDYGVSEAVHVTYRIVAGVELLVLRMDWPCTALTKREYAAGWCRLSVPRRVLGLAVGAALNYIVLVSCDPHGVLPMRFIEIGVVQHRPCCWDECAANALGA